MTSTTYELLPCIGQEVRYEVTQHERGAISVLQTSSTNVGRTMVQTAYASGYRPRSSMHKHWRCVVFARAEGGSTLFLYLLDRYPGNEMGCDNVCPCYEMLRG
jgi:hypothetical protein